MVRRNSAAVSASREIEVKNEIDRTVRATELGTSNGTREAAACICLAAAAAAAALTQGPWDHIMGVNLGLHAPVCRTSSEGLSAPMSE